MLEAEKGIDGVIVATPDHTHAIVAKTAMELGKAVYVEKPLTWSVQESRVLREVAARTKVATQMGNHGHSSDAAARVNEWIEAGVLGAVREVHIWTNRPIWPQGVPRPLKTRSVAGRRRLRQRVDGTAAQPGDLDGGCWRLRCALIAQLGSLPRTGAAGRLPPDLPSIQLARVGRLGNWRPW
jgi:nitroreductase